jgi:hypothetical protein
MEKLLEENITQAHKETIKANLIPYENWCQAVLKNW